ncbi:MAG: glycerate 2-kinase [Hyphomicrobiaceae bacterium]
MFPKKLRSDAEACWKAGLARVGAREATLRALQDFPSVPDLIVATGKAAPAMVAAAVAQFPGVTTHVLTTEGTPGTDLAGAQIAFADHPIPSLQGFAASQHILDAVARLGDGQHLLYLVSGGSSSLFEVPADDLDPQEVIEAYRALVGSGLIITDINLVRGALSKIKGGAVAAAAAPATVHTLAISDVPGDDPAVIGSGPTVARALDLRRLAIVAERLGAALAPTVRARIQAVLSQGPELPPQVPEFERRNDSGRVQVIASATDAALGAQAEAIARGYVPVRPAVVLEGEVSAVLADLAAQIRIYRRRAGRHALIRAGETVVALPASPAEVGRGGRNLQLALSLAANLAGTPCWAAAVAGTDGADGNSAVAGAVVDGATAARVTSGYGSLQGALGGFDSGRALESAGDLLATGPTGTNVGDLVVVLIEGDPGGAVSEQPC